ncbi:hypothetical protein I9018_15085 [Pseudomonas sp. MPFS]|uniref:hypothetical protein n=1 Tax=Pseudomonas sp. MPFS TaxID=2795724 RepID=UPI001F12BC03|nr:hypothetical protein [Pseudomonas sp. MPFS]UMZ14940.1 hypothetical protein I9018_15085 [Pseudomonas sp. MPFS]
MKRAATKNLSTTDWDAEIAQNTKMFYEADRLDDLAYQIIGRGVYDNQVWVRYSQAKSQADSKRREAFAQWLSIRRAMQRR